MKSFLKIILLMAVWLTACSDNNERPEPSREPVEISLLKAAATGSVDEEVEIHVRTAPHNGCWSDIEVSLHRDDERHFTLEAKGRFVGHKDGACTENLVVEDTVIRFTPTLAGKHFFRANTVPFTILRDTVEVE